MHIRDMILRNYLISCWLPIENKVNRIIPFKELFRINLPLRQIITHPFNTS